MAPPSQTSAGDRVTASTASRIFTTVPSLPQKGGSISDAHSVIEINGDWGIVACWGGDPDTAPWYPYYLETFSPDKNALQNGKDLSRTMVCLRSRHCFAAAQWDCQSLPCSISKIVVSTYVRKTRSLVVWEELTAHEPFNRGSSFEAGARSDSPIGRARGDGSASVS